MKTHRGVKLVAILMLVIFILCPFGFIIALSTGVSQITAVIEILDDEEPVKLSVTLEEEEPDPEKMKVGDGTKYYDKYHTMCDIMLSSGYYQPSSKVTSLPGDDIKLLDNFGDNAYKYLYLYSLFCEICMRDEINPRIKGAATVTNPEHRECSLTLLPVYYFFGKTLCESGLYVDYSYDQDGALSLKDFWFSRDTIMGALDGSGYTQDQKNQIAGYGASQYGFLSEEDALLETYNDAMPLFAFLRKWSSGFGKTKTVPLAYIYNPEGNGGKLWISSPCGQMNIYSANWDTPNNSSVFLYISKQENPNIEDSKRAVWGYRAGFYKPSSTESQVYKDNIATYLEGQWTDKAKELEEYYKNEWPTAHYVNSGNFWTTPDTTLEDYEAAYYENLKSDIRYGVLNIDNPVCYKSRPASYYLADSVYTLAWELRNKLQGGTAVTGSGREIKCAYSDLQCLSDVDEEERSLRELALAASTQWLPYDGPTYLNESLLKYGAESILDMTEEFVADNTKGYNWDSQFCGVRNLQVGKSETKKIQNVIQALWDSYLDAKDITEVDAFSEINIKISEDAGSIDKLVFPIPDPCRIICAFGVGAKETGYVDSTHGGIDINFLGGNPESSSSSVKVPVYAIADGTVFEVSDSCIHWSSFSDTCGRRLGNYVRIRHETVDGRCIYSTYGHLMLNSIQVKPTESVKAGDILGYMGSTGSSTGPHLHLALSYTSDWTWLEPLAYAYQVFNPDTKTYRDLFLTDVGDAECNAYYSKHAKDNIMPVVGRYDDPEDSSKHITRLEFVSLTEKSDSS